MVDRPLLYGGDNVLSVARLPLAFLILALGSTCSDSCPELEEQVYFIRLSELDDDCFDRDEKFVFPWKVFVSPGHTSQSAGLDVRDNTQEVQVRWGHEQNACRMHLRLETIDWDARVFVLQAESLTIDDEGFQGTALLELSDGET